jgi:hypothetical protein
MPEQGPVGAQVPNDGAPRSRLDFFGRVRQPVGGDHTTTAWLAIVGPILAVLGGVAYGVLRLSYEGFYDVFALSPEQAGVTSSSIVAQSGVGIVVLIFAITAVPLGCYGLMAVLIAGINEWRYRHEEGNSERPTAARSPVWRRVRTVAIWIAVLCVVGTVENARPGAIEGLGPAPGIMLLAFLSLLVITKIRFYSKPRNAPTYGGLTEEQWWFRLMAAGMVVIGVVATAYIYLVLRPAVPPSFQDFLIWVIAAGPLIPLWQWAAVTAKPIESRPEQSRMVENWWDELGPLKWLLGVLAFVVLLFLVTGLPDVARRAARCVADGRGAVSGITTPGRPFGAGPFVLLGVRAEPVELEGNGSSVPGLPRGDVVLLGQSDNAILLWDVKSRRTVRVPAGATTVVSESVRKTKSVCERDQQ